MSGKQHTGRQSDAIGDEPETSAGQRRLNRTMQATAKTYRGGPSMLGDGEMCPVDGHGRMIVGGSGRQFCPHQEHDKERVIKP